MTNKKRLTNLGSMTFKFILLSWLLMLYWAHADVVAWKIPLSRIGNIELNPRMPGLTQIAPEQSLFFSVDDKLVDVKNLISSLGEMEFDWVIWNATTKRLIAKGKVDMIWKLHKLLSQCRLPRRCQVTADFLKVSTNEWPPSEKSIHLATYSWIVNSGQTFDISNQGKQGAIQASGVAHVSRNDSYVNLTLNMSCVTINAPKIEVVTSLSMRPGQSLWVARDFDGKSGIDLKVTTNVTLSDGTPLNEELLTEQYGKIKPVVVDCNYWEEHKIGETGLLIIQSLSSSNLEKSEDVVSRSTDDPFMEVKPEKISEKSKFTEVYPPDILHSWLNRPLIDLREWTQSNGVKLSETDFVGYDPLLERLYYYSDSASVGDMLRALYSCPAQTYPRMVMVSLKDNGQFRLLVRSGRKGRLMKTLSGNQDFRLLKVKPTICRSESVHLACEYSDEINASRKRCVKTAVNLYPNDELEIFTSSIDDDSALRINANFKVDP